MIRLLQVFTGLFFGFILVLIVFEAGGRCFPDFLPERTQDALQLIGQKNIAEFIRLQESYFEGDPVLGIHIKPNMNLLLGGHPDYTFRIVTSPLPDNPSIGTRDQIKSSSSYAIAVGDSFTFGTGVEMNQVWTKRLEKLIGKSVINLGLPSACSLQYTLMLQEHGLHFSPKVILWEAYMPDIIENVWFESWLQSGGGKFYDMAAGRNRVNNSVQTSLKDRLIYWLSLHSVTFNLIKNVIRGSGREYHDQQMDIVFGGPYRFDRQDPVVQKGWPLMQQAILEAQTLASAYGAKLVVVYFPTKEEVYSDLLGKMTRVKPVGLGEVSSMLTQFNIAHQIEFLDLTPGFRKLANQKKQLYFKFDGHWNALGNETTANLIAEYLRKEKLLQLSPR